MVPVNHQCTVPLLWSNWTPLLQETTSAPDLVFTGRMPNPLLFVTHLVIWGCVWGSIWSSIERLGSTLFIQEVTSMFYQYAFKNIFLLFQRNLLINYQNKESREKLWTLTTPCGGRRLEHRLESQCYTAVWGILFFALIFNVALFIVV